jgi:hypothetical protein
MMMITILGKKQPFLSRSVPLTLLVFREPAAHLQDISRNGEGSSLVFFSLEICWKITAVIIYSSVINTSAYCHTKGLCMGAGGFNRDHSQHQKAGLRHAAQIAMSAGEALATAINNVFGQHAQQVLKYASQYAILQGFKPGTAEHTVAGLDLARMIVRQVGTKDDLEMPDAIDKAVSPYLPPPVPPVPGDRDDMDVDVSLTGVPEVPSIPPTRMDAEG